MKTKLRIRRYGSRQLFYGGLISFSYESCENLASRLSLLQSTKASQMGQS